MGQVIMSIFRFIPNSYYSKKLIDYGVKQWIYDFMPALLLVSIVGLIIWMLQRSLGWNEFTKLLVLGVGSISFYFFVAVQMRFKELNIIKHIFRI
jgi:hypothetical protein